MTACQECGDDTPNPKFCSRSCAARFSNKQRPKRQRTKRCKACQALIVSNRTYCHEHRGVMSARTDWSQTTIGELRKARPDGASNNYGRYRQMRSMARKMYVQAGLPLACQECGYDTHVDIAHIADIANFPDDTPVDDINRLDNFVALCKNHHWEFDHGYLAVNGVLKPR